MVEPHQTAPLSPSPTPSFSRSSALLSPQLEPTPAPFLPQRKEDQLFLAIPPSPSFDNAQNQLEQTGDWRVERVEAGGRRKRLKRQQNGLPLAEGYPDCNYVGNSILSCWPQSNTSLVQNVWSKFIWNSQYPTFIGAGRVDIYLYHADSDLQAHLYSNISNAQGMIAILPDDDWLPTESTFEQGRNLTWPFYFMIVDAGATLNGGEQHQSTFTVIQTAAPATLTLSSSSSGSSSPSTPTSSSSSKPSNTNSGSSNLQPSGSSSHVPTWAIALLVVFGVLALISSIIAAYLCIGSTRTRRRGTEEASAAGSSEPMLAAERASALSGSGGVLGRGAQRETPAAGLSSLDAEIMADAFRRELRNPANERRESDQSGSP